MVGLSLVFRENQRLVEFSPIIKVSFQRTKEEDFYTHYFIEVLAFQDISFRNQSFVDYPQEKQSDLLY